MSKAFVKSYKVLPSSDYFKAKRKPIYEEKQPTNVDFTDKGYELHVEFAEKKNNEVNK